MNAAFSAAHGGTGSITNAAAADTESRMNRPQSTAERQALAKLVRAARRLQRVMNWSVGLPKNYYGRGAGNMLADALDELRKASK